MKKLFAVIAAVACALAYAGAEDPPPAPSAAAPAVKLEGSLTTGLHCFIPLSDGSQAAEIYAFDNPLDGMNAPYQAIIGGRMTAPGQGLSVHVSSGYNSIPSGSSGQNSFQLWDAYAWYEIEGFTVEAGQLDEFGFVSWVDRQSYLARDRFGSAGIAVKYASGGFGAIASLPAYLPGALSNQCFRWNASVDPGTGGLDGSARAAFRSAYAAASYSLTGLWAFQAGYQGQGINAADGWNGANVWIDLSYKGVERLLAVCELELWNLGQEDPAGGSASGFAYTASSEIGWSFDRFSLQGTITLIEGDTSKSDDYDLRFQPALGFPLSGSLGANIRARVDNIGSGTFLSSQGTGKSSFWVDPELALKLGTNQVVFGAFVGNDYTGGDAAGGSWFFGNGAASTPGFDRGAGAYSASSPKYFVDVYMTLVYAF